MLKESQASRRWWSPWKARSMARRPEPALSMRVPSMSKRSTVGRMALHLMDAPGGCEGAIAASVRARRRSTPVEAHPGPRRAPPGRAVPPAPGEPLRRPCVRAPGRWWSERVRPRPPAGGRAREGRRDRPGVGARARRWRAARGGGRGGAVGGRVGGWGAGRGGGWGCAAVRRGAGPPRHGPRRRGRRWRGFFGLRGLGDPSRARGVPPAPRGPGAPNRLPWEGSWICRAFAGLARATRPARWRNRRARGRRPRAPRGAMRRGRRRSWAAASGRELGRETGFIGWRARWIRRTRSAFAASGLLKWRVWCRAHGRTRLLLPAARHVRARLPGRHDGHHRGGDGRRGVFRLRLRCAARAGGGPVWRAARRAGVGGKREGARTRSAAAGADAGGSTGIGCASGGVGHHGKNLWIRIGEVDGSVGRGDGARVVVATDGWRTHSRSLGRRCVDAGRAKVEEAILGPISGPDPVWARGVLVPLF